MGIGTAGTVGDGDKFLSLCSCLLPPLCHKSHTLPSSLSGLLHYHFDHPLHYLVCTVAVRNWSLCLSFAAVPQSWNCLPWTRLYSVRCMRGRRVQNSGKAWVDGSDWRTTVFWLVNTFNAIFCLYWLENAHHIAFSALTLLFGHLV